jgi:hypothetical protein
MKFREYLSDTVKGATDFVSERVSTAVKGIIGWTGSAVWRILKEVPIVPTGIVDKGK